jgi:hypothetical protein
MEGKETELGNRIIAQAQGLAEMKKKPGAGSRVSYNRDTNAMDADKAAALAHLQSNRLPVTVMKRPASGEDLEPEAARKDDPVKEQLSARLEEIAHQLVDAIPEKIKAASLRDVGAALSLVIDKMRLLREEPTAITEEIPGPREMLELLIKRTMERFPGTTREQVIDVISDVRPEAIKFLK